MDRQRQEVTDQAAQSPAARAPSKRRQARRIAVVIGLMVVGVFILVAGVAAWIDSHESRANPPRNGASSDAPASPVHKVRGDGAAVLPLPPDSADSPFGIYLYDDATGTWRPRLDPARTNTTEKLPEHLVVLVHGLDEPGGIWNDTAPPLAIAGLNVARFDYPNDQAIALSADLLAAWLAELHARGVRSVDLVGHSMGGLVLRDVLSRDQPGYYQGHGAQSLIHTHPGLPDARRLITVATPHAGAELARYRALAELREHASRLAEQSWTDLNAILSGTDSAAASLRDTSRAMQQDGDGQAGHDLLPNSAFLLDLNTRPWPKDVATTAIIGIVSADAADAASWISRTVGTEGPWHTIAGDGIVSQASATPGPPVTDAVVVSGTHRGILVRWIMETGERSPPAVDIIVDRLTNDNER